MSLVKKPSGLTKPAMKKPAGKPAVKPAILVKPKEGVVKDLEQEQVVEELAPVQEAPQIEPEVVEEQPEVVVEEPKEEVKEEVKEAPKTKKKAASKKKKEEVKEEVVVDEIEEGLPQKELKEALVDLEKDMNISEEGWDEVKLEIQDKLKALTIDPDMNPSSMKILIGELDNVMTELRFLKIDLETQVKALNEQVEYIRVSNSTGSNSEQRKANGYKALMNHKKNPNDTEVINLIQVQIFMNSKLNFLTEAIETVKDRRQLLITFSSMLKIETSF